MILNRAEDFVDLQSTCLRANLIRAFAKNISMGGK